MNFILALAYYYCLALPAEFMQPEAHILAQPCHSYIYLTLHFARCLFGELLPPLATPDDLPLMSFIVESPISQVQRFSAELPLGRVKRLLKSNSMTAIANINFGWRRETSV